MLLRVTHETEFDYSDDITESVMEVRLTPVDTDRQSVRSYVLDVDPRAKLFGHTDYFGNIVQFFTIPRKHRRVSVVSSSVVDTSGDNPFDLEQGHGAPPVPFAGALFDYLQFGGPVSRHPELAAIASRFRSEEDVFSQLQGINRAIHDRLEYKPLVTRVDSPLDEVIELGQGVCQDFAHLMIGVCRELALPSRYVSGYIYTPNNSGTRGAGASHAWCECYMPGTGWKGFDPTNNLLVDEHYVQIGVGRDYRDVPPTKGIYRGGAQEDITVTVRTEAIDRRVR